MYQFAANSSVSKTLPTKMKYRPRGMLTTALLGSQKSAVNGKHPQWFRRKVVPAAIRDLRSRGTSWEKAAICLFADLLENGMADPDIVETACARAWSVYLMINRGLDENDARRALLKRFLRQRWEAGNSEAEFLAVEGLKYLKSLEGSSPD
jgi:hypothetical protein